MVEAARGLGVGGGGGDRGEARVWDEDTKWSEVLV